MTKAELFDLVGITGDRFIVLCDDVWSRAEGLLFMRDVIGDEIWRGLIDDHYLEPELEPEADYPNLLIHRNTDVDCTRSREGDTVRFDDFARAVGIDYSKNDPPVFELPPVELLLS